MKDAKIFLTGFMGAGKSTWGEQLAKVMKLPFYDLDKVIEQKTASSVSSLFLNHGEPYFRTLETKILIELAALPGAAVIATGGGTPCLPVNRSVMTQSGKIIYLKVSKKTLFQRLKSEKEQRPLIADKSKSELQLYIASSLKVREPDYLIQSEVVGENEISIDRLKKIAAKA